MVVPTVPERVRVKKFLPDRWLSRARRGAAGRVLQTRRGKVGVLLVAMVVGIAAVGPALAPHSTTSFVTAPFAPPSGDALLGGDVLGRDVLSRVLGGGWLLLVLASLATLLGVGIGMTAGVAAAYFSGWTDSLIMRAIDVVLAFPQLVFALLLLSILGSKLWLIVVAVGASHAPQTARVIRSAALDIAKADYVEAAQIGGEGPWWIVLREITPNLTSVMAVEVGLRLTFSIVLIAGLSFIGFGVQPPAANWGLMINENRIGLITNPWAVVVPVILIALLTVGMNTLTDAIARVSLGVDSTARVARPVVDGVQMIGSTQ